jgi:hypothetical protein
MRSPPSRIGIAPGAAWLVAVLAAGCSGDSGVGKTFPVAGKITLDDEPLTAQSTVVLFQPDASRGNESPFDAAGTVDETGTYKLTTRGKSGAAPGWYKVVVTARSSSTEHAKSPHGNRPAPRSLLPEKYGLASTSGLAVEVVESPAPGAYDLRLTR